MIYIVVLCNSRTTAEPLYIRPYAAANNMALLAWRPSQGVPRRQPHRRQA